MNKYDSIIIGFGKGGKTMAGYLAGRGEKVAMVEKSDKMYGGTCINVGCIPSKSLVGNAIQSRKNKTASFEEKSKLYREAILEKRTLVEMLRKKNHDKLYNDSNVTIYNGFASFSSSNKVVVDNGKEKYEIEGEKIFINTGAAPVIPNIPGIKNNPNVFFSETLMDLETLPEKLFIIGGGYIGLEFASMYSNFGAQVTVLQDGETLVPREDRDIANSIQGILEDKGIAFKLGAKIKEIRNDGEKAVVVFD